MSEKNDSRLRRARRARARMARKGVNRLTVHRTPRHIYAQVFTPEGDRVLASASTLDKDLRGGSTGNQAAAAAVLDDVAEALMARWLADQRIVDALSARGERLDHAAGAVDRGAFLVTGDQERY